MKTNLSVKLWAPIRENDSGEWIDYLSISTSLEQVKFNSRRANEDMSGWARANPVVRIARVEIREIKNKTNLQKV